MSEVWTPQNNIKSKWNASNGFYVQAEHAIFPKNIKVVDYFDTNRVKIIKIEKTANVRNWHMKNERGSRTEKERGG
jgi:hypothetical protein